MDLETTEPRNRRWYDSYPKIVEAIRLLEIVPDEIQTIISEGVLLLIEKEFRITKIENTYSSLGREKILMLYRSKSRQRRYDKNAFAHKIMNYMLCLGEREQEFIADSVIALMNQTFDYFKICKEYVEPPNMVHVVHMRDLYVEVGPQQVALFLKEIKVEFKAKVEKMLDTPKAKPPVKEVEVVTDVDEAKITNKFLGSE